MILFLKNNRLPRRIILRRKKEIEDVFHHSYRWFGEFVNIYFKESEGDPGVAFFIKKKIGKAVTRNRSKRLVREFYRTHKKYFANLKVIFIVKKSITDFSVFKKEMENFFQNETYINLDH